MTRSLLRAALGGLSLAGLPAALHAQAVADAPATAQAAAEAPAPEEENSGQDPTRPVSRFDVRVGYQDLPEGRETELLTFRMDKPFALGGGLKLNTRVDLPFMMSTKRGPNNPDGDNQAGLGDLLLQGLVIVPMKDKWAFAAGSQLIIPTGSPAQFSSGKWELVPTVALVRQMPTISPGSFLGFLVRDTFSFAGPSNRANINIVSVEPLANFQLPGRWFITFGPEIKFNTLDNWNVNVPFDMTVGKKVTKNVVISLQGDVSLVDDFPGYDWKAEFRVGFFF